MMIDGNIIGEPVRVYAVAELQAELSAGTYTEAIMTEYIHRRSYTY